MKLKVSPDFSSQCLIALLNGVVIVVMGPWSVSEGGNLLMWSTIRAQSCSARELESRAENVDSPTHW